MGVVLESSAPRLRNNVERPKLFTYLKKNLYAALGQRARPLFPETNGQHSNHG